MNLQQAISNLNPARDFDWTADGLPRMDAIAEMTGDNTVTRKQVTDAAPGLMRDNAPEIQDDAIADDGDRSEDQVVVDEEDAPDAAPPSSLLEEEEEEPLDVLTMRIDEVLRSPDLTKMALDAIKARASSKLVERNRIDAELKELYSKSEMLTRANVQHDQRAKAQGTKNTNVQDYLASQAKSRADRAARARKFIEAGTTIGDVVAQIHGSSPLDNAMKQRRPARGSQRPAPRQIQS